MRSGGCCKNLNRRSCPSATFQARLQVARMGTQHQFCGRRKVMWHETMPMQALPLSRRSTAEAAEAAGLGRKVFVADMRDAIDRSAGCVPATLLLAEPYYRACEQQLPWAHLVCAARVHVSGHAFSLQRKEPGALGIAYRAAWRRRIGCTLMLTVANIMGCVARRSWQREKAALLAAGILSANHISVPCRGEHCSVACCGCRHGSRLWGQPASSKVSLPRHGVALLSRAVCLRQVPQWPRTLCKCYKTATSEAGNSATSNNVQQLDIAICSTAGGRGGVATGAAPHLWACGGCGGRGSQPVQPPAGRGCAAQTCASRLDQPAWPTCELLNFLEQYQVGRFRGWLHDVFLQTR